MVHAKREKGVVWRRDEKAGEKERGNPRFDGLKGCWPYSFLRGRYDGALIPVVHFYG